MTSGPTCRCLLCQVEKQLRAELASSTVVYDALRNSSSNGLRAFVSPLHLLSHLKATTAGPSSDDLFRDLLAARDIAARCVETLMIVAFVPVLHGTVRRIAQQQTRLTRADITQQALTAFLEVLRSEQNQGRQSHLAFAISRAVKRRLFEWAGREGFAHATHENGQGSGVLELPEDTSMERHAALGHFLDRCLAKGLLNGDELDLLIQIKLDGNTGEEIAELNSTTPNAVKQRMKRLLAKLRRIAGSDPLAPGK